MTIKESSLKATKLEKEITVMAEFVETTNRLKLDPEAFKNLELRVKTDMATMEKEIAKSRVLEAALSSLKAEPGFNPGAISISFGLRW